MNEVNGPGVTARLNEATKMGQASGSLQTNRPAHTSGLLPVSRPNLNLSGIGTAPGGIYEDVEVQGIAKVDGDIECVRCNIEGVSKIFGRVKAESVDIRGNAKVCGDVHAAHIRVEGNASVLASCEATEKLHIRGNVKVGGNVVGNDIFVEGNNKVEGDFRGQNVRIRGGVKVGGGVHADSVTVEGLLRVRKSCEAEIFESDGSFSIDGLLNAGQIAIRLNRNSRVREIGGETIRVERGRGRGAFRKRLDVGTIEGDDIYLEYTNVKVVRGNKVVLGPGTNVELVEYRSEFQNPGKAKFGRSKRV